jgi:hypothetical protein
MILVLSCSEFPDLTGKSAGTNIVVFIHKLLELSALTLTLPL